MPLFFFTLTLRCSYSAFRLTSLPGWRDAPRSETNHRYFEFKQLWLCECIEISRFFMSVACCGRCWRLLTSATWKITFTSSPLPWFAKSLFSWRNGNAPSQQHHRARFVFQTHRTVWSGFPSHSPALSSYCQPCGRRVCSCHATSPHRLVPRIQAIKDPWSGCDTLRIL